jgi:hypothetical protein
MTLRMFRSFLDGLAAMVGFRVGEAVVQGARREIGRSVRQRNAQSRAAFLEELAAAARQLPGGTADSAFVVASSAQIEPQASRIECLACDDGRLTLEQHRAETIHGMPVRAIDLTCRVCASPRTAYFRIERAS